METAGVPEVRVPGDNDQSPGEIQYLDDRIVEVIKKLQPADDSHPPRYIVRPAQVASELGISIDDANAELCGLMRAVGQSSTFLFESVGIEEPSSDHQSSTSAPRLDDPSRNATTVMVFSFPMDFERKAYLSKNKEHLKEFMWKFICVLFKILKVVTAFGLIISAITVVIFVTVIMLALIVGFARSEGRRMNHHVHRISSSIRLVGYMLRQFFWMYMIIRGFDQVDQQVDPFIADIAYTLAFICNPYSYLMWFRMMNRRRRNSRATRGWSNHNSGVSYSRRSTWTSIRNNQEGSNGSNSNAANDWYSRNEDCTNNGLNSSREQQQHEERGLLSNLVEFLFGPSPFQPGPTEFSKWKLREHFILSQQLCVSSNSERCNQEISLIQFLPFVDNPPSNYNLDKDEVLLKNARMKSECLHIVTHFNGVPYKDRTTSPGFNAKFVFPELLSFHAENLIGGSNISSFESYDDSEFSFFYCNEQCSTNNNETFPGEGHILGGSRYRNNKTISNEVSESSTSHHQLVEQRYAFTKLSKKQFWQCIKLNFINFVGLKVIIYFLKQAEANVQMRNGSSFNWYGYLKPVVNSLLAYARFFFILPVCRMVVLWILNLQISKRNTRRKIFAKRFRQNIRK